MADYPNTTARRELPYLAVIRQRDPDYLKDRRIETEYCFPGRTFTADQSTRGPYNFDPNGDLIFIGDSGEPASSNSSVYNDDFNDDF